MTFLNKFGFFQSLLLLNFFLSFKTHMERYFECSIKAIQSDWYGELYKLHIVFKSLGIPYRSTCPHTHQQNGSIKY